MVEFTHHFRPYLLGKKFTLRTDHSSFIWMQNFKEPEGQLARWLEKLQEYDFSILHRQGSRHSNADALSRIPCRQCGRGDLCGKIVDEVCAVDAVLPYIPQTNSLDEVRRMQAEDNIVGPVLEAVERGKVTFPSRGVGRAACCYNNGTHLSATVGCSGDVSQRERSVVNWFYRIDCMGKSFKTCMKVPLELIWEKKRYCHN